MKKTTGLSLTVILILFVACAKEELQPSGDAQLKSTNSGDLPAAVIESFNAMFPDAKNVEWESEKTGEWEGEFTQNRKEIAGVFDSEGNWLATETEMKVKDVPKSIVNVAKNAHSGYNVKEAERVEMPDQNGYELELKKKKSEIDVLISDTGEILATEEESD